MVKKPALLGLVVSCLVGGVRPAFADPSTAELLGYKPRQKEAVFQAIASDDAKSLSVQKLSNAQNRPYGWLVTDARNQPVRRILDLNGDGNPDLWGYYRDGQETYREIDSNYDGRPDQYRWFNQAGMKWGVDANSDGVIDTWRLISAEEVGHEAFLAIAGNNPQRLQALLITESEMKLLKFPQAQVDRIKGIQAKLGEKFQKLAGNPKLQAASFLKTESAVPNCAPADSLGTEADVLKFAARDVLYKHVGAKGEEVDLVHLGEMIQVGLAWRLVDLGSEPTATPGGGDTGDPEEQKLFARLGAIDKELGTTIEVKSAKEVQLLMERAQVAEQIAVKKPNERDTWLKQTVEALALASQADQKAMARLVQYKDELAKAMPNSPLAAYAHYRQINAYFMPQLVDVKGDTIKVQESWNEALAKFVGLYPKSDDTPDALVQVGQGSEFAGKDQEAVRWYKQLSASFPNHPLSAKADGAVRRLESVGKRMELNGPQLTSQTPFDISQLKDNVVIVYYWATYCESCPKEFAQLKAILNQNAGKKLALVSVNLDDSANKAIGFLQQASVPGVHLFQLSKDNQGGLSSPYAVHYGINGLPTLFLIDRNGNVVRHSMQITELDEALKKAL